MNNPGYSEPPPYDDGQFARPRVSFPTVTPMVKMLLIVNAAVYGLCLLIYLANPAWHSGVTTVVGLDTRVWREFFPFVPIWQLLSYGFVHSIGPGHLLFNMLGLYFFGGMVESTVGPRRFLVAYLVAVLIGGLAFLGLDLATGGGRSVVGASGGVLAMIVAAAVFRPNAQVIFILFPIQLKWLAGMLVALDLVNGALTVRAGGQAGGTAYVVHLVGAAVGFVMVKRGWIWKDPVETVRTKRAVAAEVKRQDDDQKVDELLEKIHRDGLNALSKREKDFLKRVSSRGK